VDIAAQAEVEPGRRGLQPRCIDVAARGEVEPSSRGRCSRSLKDPISNSMNLSADAYVRSSNPPPDTIHARLASTLWGWA
jgi:hypothetical protein